MKLKKNTFETYKCSSFFVCFFFFKSPPCTGSKKKKKANIIITFGLKWKESKYTKKKKKKGSKNLFGHTEVD